MRWHGGSEGVVSDLPRLCAKNIPLKIRGWASEVVRRRGVSKNRFFYPFYKKKKDIFTLLGSFEESFMLHRGCIIRLLKL